MAGKRFRTTLIQDDDTSGCAVELPFDPRDVFGKVRAPVKVTIRGHTFRTTTFSMGGCYMIPVNRANREGAGIAAGDRIQVDMALDTEPRVITPPADFKKAMKAKPPAWARWQDLSYSHQREHVEAIKEAKRPETRARRIDKAVEMLSAKTAKKKKRAKAAKKKRAVKKKRAKKRIAKAAKRKRGAKAAKSKKVAKKAKRKA